MTDDVRGADVECSGPFTDARDCPVCGPLVRESRKIQAERANRSIVRLTPEDVGELLDSYEYSLNENWKVLAADILAARQALVARVKAAREGR